MELHASVREKKSKGSSSGRRSRDARGAADSGSGSDGADAESLLTMEGIPDTAEGAEEMFRAALEAVSEKRRETRILGLRKVASFLAHRVSADLLGPTTETLTAYLVNSIKKGDSDEQKFACRAASILLLTLGVDGLASYTELSAAMLRLASTSASDSTVAAALESVALGTYICSEDPNVGAEVLERMHAAAINEASGTLTACAGLFGRALLLTLLPTREFLESSFFTEMEELQTLLDHTATEIRLAAGHNIALLFDLYNEEVETGAAIADVIADIDVDSLAERIGELASDSSRYVARATRVEQKVFFRELLRIVEESQRPEVSITVGTTKIMFRSWAQLTVFEAIKGALGGGINAHFAANPLLADMFPSLEIDNARLSAVEKRAVRSPNSPQVRARDQTRGSARDRKAAERGGGGAASD